MQGADQCGLCLSCGAPFMPTLANVKLFGHRANLSILYLEEKCNNNEMLRKRFKDPKFAGTRHGSHMFHEGHHAQAIQYMSKHHVGDDGPATPVVDVLLPAINSAFPFFKNESKKNHSCLASWPRPPLADRVDMAPILDHILGAGDNGRDALFSEDVGVKYCICNYCNGLMTQLSYMRYIVGFASTANKNPHGSVISETFHGISCYPADKMTTNLLDSAYGVWKRSRGNAVEHFPMRQGVDDPTAPHIAYYLHLCLPYTAGPADDVFAVMGASMVAARSTYTQLCWLVLIIACVATQVEKGKTYGDHHVSHGQHQLYGVLDVYVSFFFWRLMSYDYSVDLRRSGLDFVQWHQKFFWEAVHLPGIGARDHVIFGFATYSTVDINSKALIQDLGARLMGLYTDQLRPLVLHVTGNTPVPPALVSDADVFVRRFFVSLQSLRRMRRLSASRVHEDDFDSSLAVFGIHALLGRVHRLCSEELKAMLVSFRRAWSMLEIDRVRLKNPGLSMRSASVVVALCRLLDPPVELPHDKVAADAILYAAKCSAWNSVLALRELGAFTSSDRDARRAIV